MISERPFVTKDDLLVAIDPLSGAGDAAFKRLRKANVISNGVSFRPRRDGHLAGSVTLYSSFNRDAIFAYRQNAAAKVKNFHRAARKIEESVPRDDLLKHLGELPEKTADDLTSTALFLLLTKFSERSELNQDWVHLRNRLVHDAGELSVRKIAGTVSTVDELKARVESDNGSDFDLPVGLLANMNLDHAGALVLILLEEMHSGVAWTKVEEAFDSNQGGDAGSTSTLRPRPLPADLDRELDLLLEGKPHARSPVPLAVVPV